ncbi:MAG TPA: hypothetical protein PKB13_08960 [Clostridia bacterium]|nr:hypothetical protein [Clostridia bacterium]
MKRIAEIIKYLIGCGIKPENLIAKMNVFVLFDEMTEEEYAEIMALLTAA